MNFFAGKLYFNGLFPQGSYFRIFDLPEVVFYGSKSFSSRFNFGFCTHCLLRNSCIGYLTHIVDTRVKDVRLEDIPVVQDFLDLFYGDLPRLPPKREIDFATDLILGTNPIYFPLYRMGPAKLKELKVQL